MAEARADPRHARPGDWDRTAVTHAVTHVALAVSRAVERSHGSEWHFPTNAIDIESNQQSHPSDLSSRRVPLPRPVDASTSPLVRLRVRARPSPRLRRVVPYRRAFVRSTATPDGCHFFVRPSVIGSRRVSPARRAPSGPWTVRFSDRILLTVTPHVPIR